MLWSVGVLTSPLGKTLLEEVQVLFFGAFSPFRVPLVVIIGGIRCRLALNGRRYFGNSSGIGSLSPSWIPMVFIIVEVVRGLVLHGRY